MLGIKGRYIWMRHHSSKKRNPLLARPHSSQVKVKKWHPSSQKALSVLLKDTEAKCGEWPLVELEPWSSLFCASAALRDRRSYVTQYNSIKAEHTDLTCTHCWIQCDSVLQYSRLVLFSRPLFEGRSLVSKSTGKFYFVSSSSQTKRTLWQRLSHPENLGEKMCCVRLLVKHWKIKS